MVIGVTGGVGTGKSTILSILESDYDAKIILADDVCRDLMEPGESCYQPIIDELGEEVLTDGPGSPFNRARIAEIVFNDDAKRDKINSITHPLVKEEIIRMIDQYNIEGVKYIIVESAIIIEAKYLDILDELWVVITDYWERVDRLISSRHYTIKKINEIIAAQMSDEEYISYADFVIDNSETLEYARKQIHDRLDERNYHKF